MNDINSCLQPTQQVFSPSAEVIPFERASVPARDDYVEAIQIWCKTRDVAEILSREELGAMSHKDRMDAQRKGLIIALAHYYRKHERADVAPGVLAILNILSDNERGIASVSQPTLAKLLGRSVSSIGDAQRRLKEDGLITMTRGRYAGATPVIPRIVTAQYNHTTWLVGALTEAEKPSKLPAGPVDCQSTGRPGGLNQSTYGAGGLESVNQPVEDGSINRPAPHQLLSKSSLSIPINAGARVAVGIAAAMTALPVAAAPAIPPIEQVQNVPAECWQTPSAQQAAALNVHELRAQKQVWITPTGLIEIAGAFKQEMAEAFPLVDIVSALAAAGPNIRRDRGALDAMVVIRRQFGYMQQNAAQMEKRAAARQQAPKQTAESLSSKYDRFYDGVL